MENDRQEIIDSNPLPEMVSSYGIELKAGAKGELVALCPFHNEKTPSFTVNPVKNVFYCFGCGINGSVIDFVSKKDGSTIGQAMEKLSKRHPGAIASHSSKSLEIEKKYFYYNEKNEEVFRVIRYKPKTFRQCRVVDGKPVWSLEGVKRVLYRLPQIIKAQQVLITEGEKDVETLVGLGFEATCNAGGSGKWMDAYTDSLKGKDIVICPDNDEPGKKHADILIQSLTGKVNSIKLITIPEPFKDVSEWNEANKEKRKTETFIQEWIDNAPNIQGLDLPIYTMADLEKGYREFVQESEKHTLNFEWLPGLRKHVRGLVPGELVAILADTGVGKTAIIQNIAFHARPLKVLLFELELADHLIFERFTQIRYKVDGGSVETAYKNGTSLSAKDDDRTSHIFTCPLSRQTPETIEKFIVQSELKIGQRPNVVIIDYVGLVQGVGGSRYERLSHIAEEIKRIAKATKTIIIIASQVHRKDSDDNEIYLHDAKDSGSIENSAGLVIGAWKETQEKMMLKILKNTKGGSGWKIPCNFDGRTLTITEMKETPKNPYD